jgi:D-cysteine desulfhydrase family pyridoxal phosphate-dependent enzyme
VEVTLLLARFPRVSLCELPTPLQRMPRFGGAIGHDQLFIKRDDLTGLATGGNKARKLEFFLGEALAQGADVILTESFAQSNHCRQSAAACARLGLECVLVFASEEPPIYQANLLLDYLAGAKLIFAGRISLKERNKVLNREAERLARSGRRPYVIPMGGSVPRGGIAYVDATFELMRQCDERRIDLKHIVICKGTGGTAAGIAATSALLGKPFELHVVAVEGDGGLTAMRSEIVGIADDVLATLGRRAQVPIEDTFTLYDDYLGAGYSIATPEGIDTIKLLARSEGIFLGPVHAGKGVAGLRDLVRKGRIPAAEPALFWHTGGVTELFVQPELFRPERGG